MNRQKPSFRPKMRSRRLSPKIVQFCVTCTKTRAETDRFKVKFINFGNREGYLFRINWSKYYPVYMLTIAFVRNSKKMRPIYEKNRLQFQIADGIIKILGYYAEIYSLKFIQSLEVVE